MLSGPVPAPGLWVLGVFSSGAVLPFIFRSQAALRRGPLQTALVVSMPPTPRAPRSPQGPAKRTSALTLHFLTFSL